MVEQPKRAALTSDVVPSPVVFEAEEEEEEDVATDEAEPYEGTSANTS